MEAKTPLRVFMEDLEWMHDNIRIVAKSGEVVPLHLNYAQERLVAACIQRLKIGLPVRIIVLKARQLGISTFVQALSFTRSCRRTGVRGVLIAHQDDSTHKIWGMHATFMRHAGVEPLKKSFAEADGPLIWTHDSRLSCMTAGGKDIAHGETINLLHMSEASRYGEGQSPDQQARVVRMVAGIQAAVAKTPDSMVFIESTANGVGNWFHQQWTKAKKGEVDYEPVFIAWHEHPEYRRPLEFGPIHDESDLSAFEQRLREQFGLALEQLNWRRHTIANECNGDERLFCEQYPATDDEAFLVTGSTVFDPDRIAAYLRHARPPVWRGDISLDPPQGWILEERERGPLCVWQWPRRDDGYAIGADTAECLDTQSDRDAAVVRSARSCDVVATLAGHWEPGEYAQKLAALGWLYNEALLAVERNAVTGVIGMLRGRLGGDELYRNLYRYERVDRATKVREMIFGFSTTRQSKHAAVEAERELLRSGQEDCPSEELLTEARTFSNLGNGKMGATAGCRDDLVTAWCISAAVVHRVALPGQTDHREPWERMEEFLEALNSGARDETDY